ncbi:T9SS type A sorting domain-containing protein [bacterium]
MKVIKSFLIMLLLSVSVSQVQAQVTIHGTVSDPHSNPVTGVLVEMIDEGDTTIVFSDVTDASGLYIIDITDTGIDGEKDSSLPENLLLQNYPNPFNPETVIQYYLPKRSFVKIDIYDILGRKVKTLLRNSRPGGIGKVTWNATNDRGMGVAAGVYICRIKTDDSVLTRKMLLTDGVSNRQIIQGVEMPSDQVNKTYMSSRFASNFTLRVTGQFIEKLEMKNLVIDSDSTFNLEVSYKSSNTIGVSGGKIGSSDGAVILTIPPGALTGDTLIDIQVLPENEYPAALDTFNFLGDAYRLLPEDLEFDVPVVINREFTSTEIDSLYLEEGYPFVQGLSLSSDGELTLADSSSVTYDSDTTTHFSAQITHFSVEIVTFEVSYFNIMHGKEQRFGKSRIKAEMGPNISGVGRPITPSLTIINDTDFDMAYTVEHRDKKAVSWPGEVEFRIVVRERQTLDYNYTIPWMCETMGEGDAHFRIEVTPESPYFRGEDIQRISHYVDCVGANDVPPSCGDENLHYMMPYCLEWFEHEPCAAVNEPMGDGTVTSTWGEVHIIIGCMANTYGWGVFNQYVTEDQWSSILDDFAFNDDGLAVGESSGGMPEKSSGMMVDEDYLIFFNVMQDTIPLIDPENYYQFGFVFDIDGDTTNNYQPAPEFAYDFYQDTDYWIEVIYDPAFGWFMFVNDVSNGELYPADSDAKMIIVGNTLITFVPKDEFLADVIGYRMTAYRHTGDWGMTSGDWDGDVQPPVAEGLRWLYIGSD